MNRRTAGISLIFISAFLYAARYIAAATYGSGQTSWSAELFRGLLQYVGGGLVTWSIVALVAGVFFLVLAEITELRSAKDE